MAVPSNTVQTFAMVGIREDLSDAISNIDPTETIMYTKIKKGKCDNRTPEWQIDTRRAANADNAAIEGDDATNSSTSQPTRVKNVVQLFEGTVQTSSTSDAVKTAGRANEMDYMIAKEGEAMKRDMEARISGNYASVLGNASTAGKMAGYEAWITTNDSRGSGAGAQGGYNSGTGLVAAATDGDQRAFTETIFKAAIKTCWTNGAKAPLVIAGASNKQVISGFAGIAQATNEVKGSDMVTIVGAADIYQSDYGTHRIVASRNSRDRSVLLMDPSLWELKFLQPFKRQKLAKTGHNNREMLSAECTLASKNEKGNGIIADLTTS
jgi:hypothetical protein